MIKPRLNITKNTILRKIAVQDLYSYYFNIKEIPCVISSPLRADKNPSMSIRSPDGINVYFRDFSTGESGDIFTLLQSYWGLSFSDTLNRIYTDLSLNKKTKGILRQHIPRSKVNKTSHANLQVKIRDFKEHDIKYWQSYGVDLNFLKKANVFPVSHILKTKNGILNTFIADKYAYVFVEKKDDKLTLKVYQPFNKKYKWANSNDSSVWSLWRLLPPKGDTLIITSSLKDALCIFCNTGIPSVSLQAESYIPKESVINILKKRFNNIYILYDNDFNAVKNWGQLASNKIAELFNLKQIKIPTKYKSKDTSDLYKNTSKQTVIDVINKLIKNN